MQKIGFSLQSSYTLPMQDVLSLLRNVGFCAVSPPWQRDLDLRQTVVTAEKNDLLVQSLHAPYRGLAGMWSRDISLCKPIVQDIMDAAKDCATYHIPVLVVHSWGGMQYTYREDDLFFDHFERLIDFACRHGIRIAFENLEGPEYLAALLAHYANEPTVGLCWDCGHELCYNPGWDFLKDYGDRLLMTHLNDNYGLTDPQGQLRGTDDLHLLPYDGILDWTKIIRQLQQSRRQEILNFELKIRPKGDRCITDLYSKIPLETYLAEAYARICKAVGNYFE